MSQIRFNVAERQKKKFYSQELFDDHTHLKKNLRLVVIMIGLFEIARAVLVETQKKTSTLEGYQKWVTFFTTSLGSILYIISTFKFVDKTAFKCFHLRRLFLLLSSLGLSVGTFLRALWEIRFVLKSNDIEVWLDTLSISINLAFGMALTDVIFPTWILRILLPLGFFIGFLIAIIESSSANSFVLIFRLTTIFMYIVCLYIIKDQFRWKIFLKRMEDETWKALQMKILEEIPTSISILNLEQRRIIYTNEEFKRWIGASDPLEMFKKVNKIIQRREKEKIINKLEFESEIEGSFTKLEKCPVKFQQADYIDDQSQDPPFTPRTFQNESLTLYDLLVNFCKKKDKLKSKAPWLGVYDGIYMRSNEMNSLEIKISILSEPAVALIMINDTTQRDLLVTLQSNNKYKDNLLASISHELRTPLNGTLALLESAIDHREASKCVKEEYLAPAWKSTQILVHIINDILDYSQLGSNTIRLALEDRSIIQTLRDCYSLMEIQALKRGLKFVLSIHNNVPHSLVTDHNRIKQILLNLLSNAIKFTFEGEVRIEAKMIERNILNVAVTDTGIGIKSEEIERIFNKYSSIQEDKITKHCAGVGLGLTVANNLARLLGDQGIKISSQFGKGSTFSFNIQRKSLPKFRLNSSFLIDDKDNSRKLLHVSDTSSSVDEFNAGERSPAFILDEKKYRLSTNLKDSFIFRRSILHQFDSIKTEDSPSPQISEVLIVDDDSFNIIALESLLKGKNLKLDKAFNGKEAIEKIQKKNELNNRSSNYKLVLMDFNMPIMDGREATRILKEMMDTGSLPQINIVGCTAYNTKQDIEAGIRSGMAEVITKPLTRDLIAPILRKYLEIY